MTESCSLRRAARWWMAACVGTEVRWEEEAVYQTHGGIQSSRKDHTIRLLVIYLDIPIVYSSV